MTLIVNFLKTRFLQGWPLVILVVVIGVTQLLRITNRECDYGGGGGFRNPFLNFEKCDPIISEEGQLIIIATTIAALAIYPKANA